MTYMRVPAHVQLKVMPDNPQRANPFHKSAGMGTEVNHRA